MSVSYRCPVCGRLNAAKAQSCRQCGQVRPRKPIFVLDYREGGQRKRRTLGDITITEAQRIDAEVRSALRDNAPLVIEIGPPVSGATWGELVRHYRTDLQARERTGSLTRYEKYFRVFADEWGDDRPLTEITPEMISSVKMRLRESGLAQGTVDLHLSICRAAWKSFDTEVKNPFVEVSLFHADNRVTRYLTDAQRVALLAAARGVSRDYYEMIVVALTTGLRRANVVLLKRTEVDWEAGTINVVQKGATRHTAIVPPDVLDMLKAIPAIDGSDYFWISSVTRRPYHLTSHSTWKRIKHLAGIPREFRWHDLRHSAATAALAATGNLQLVSELLGHSSVRHTTRYAHTRPEQRRQLADILSPLKKQTGHSVDTFDPKDE